MKKIIITEVVWLIIAASVFGALSVLSKMTEPIVVGMLVYVGIRISYLYGLYRR